MNIKPSSSFRLGATFSIEEKKKINKILSTWKSSFPILFYLGYYFANEHWESKEKPRESKIETEREREWNEKRELGRKANKVPSI